VASVDASQRGGLTVAIVGAECAGKTTLAAALAARFSAPWVPEHARDYLTHRGAYTADDVVEIARAQHRAEAAAVRGSGLVFMDTDLVVIKVWWAVRFGGSHPWVDTALHTALRDSRARRYLLATPDIAWVADPLREHPNERPLLHVRYRELLDALGAQYIEVSGSPSERLERAADAVTRWMAETGASR
jgi:NadR type nicotinamide-nucleotide adenylyltransferase